MYKWFRDCKTAEQGKELYRKLAKQFHPDNGGSGIELKEIISEFKTWWEVYKDIHIYADTGETYKSKRSTKETAEDFIDIVNKLSTLPGIEVELCGTWLWITGNTYPNKQALRSFGCRWSKGKKKWYWTKDEYQKVNSHTTMEDIRRMYGSESIQLNRNLCIE